MKDEQHPDKELYGDSLISLSSSDLESSRLLFVNGINHNSLFFLQQSIEKLVKAIGLDIGIIEPDRMAKISHRPHKVYKTATDQSNVDIAELDKAPEIKKILTDQDGFSDYMEKLKTATLFFIEQHKYDFEYLDEEEFSEILGALEYIATNSESMEIDYKEYCKLMLEIFSTDSSWSRSELNLEDFELKMKSVLEIEVDLSKINSILLWLALITQKHQDAVRYPCKCCGESPLVNYNLETPIVKYFVNIFNLQMHCLTKYSEIRMRIKKLSIADEEE